MKRLIVLLMLLMMGFSLNAQVIKKTDIPNPGEPVVFIHLIEIPAQDIERFVTDWNERAKTVGQQPGHMTSTLYRSLLADARYQIISIAQWQSYDAWATANNNRADARLSQGTVHAKDIQLPRHFYRPVAWSTNTYKGSFTGEEKQSVNDKAAPLQRAQKNPEIKFPEMPFMFINLMEMNPEDVAPFISDWKIRSGIMGQMPAAMGSTLYKSTLPDNRFQIINVSQWQSYNGFIDANNDPVYARELSADLGHTPSIKLIRGFYRPVASHTHTY